ncbi:MAG: LL-diaminopimelate aminotransferase [Candidatus Rokubacteria bacterium]|nr:LL-diaminopimelate aminotransferase [Candidatus Rokubacteria bacterium]
MPRINESYLNLRASYLFAERPYAGYEFLLEAIAEHDFASRGVRVGLDEIFVSDGGKSDSANLPEIFAPDSVVALMDPAYPVYADTNVIAGRSGPADESGRYPGLVYLPCTADNNFEPAFPERRADIIYLCYPNNPTGAVVTKAGLRRWVDYAREHDAVILFDAAYEAYVRDPDLPRSIYEIEGAREVAIESRSYSKTAGFTGMRLAYTVVPKELRGRTAAGKPASLNELWTRRVATKSNGPPYPIQKAAAALYTPEGRAQVRALVDFYMENARIIRTGLGAAGLTVHGGAHAPYLWLRTPAGVTSWDFFDRMLTDAHVVGTPGSGFGPAGEGYYRLTAFGSREGTEEAVARVRTRL